MIKLQNGGAILKSPALRDLQCKQSRLSRSTVCAYANRSGPLFRRSSDTLLKILQGLLEIEIYTQKSAIRGQSTKCRFWQKYHQPSVRGYCSVAEEKLGRIYKNMMNVRRASDLSWRVRALATVFLGRRTALFLESLCWALLRDDTVRVVVKVFGVMDVGFGTELSWLVGFNI